MISTQLVSLRLLWVRWTIISGAGCTSGNIKETGVHGRCQWEIAKGTKLMPLVLLLDIVSVSRGQFPESGDEVGRGPRCVLSERRAAPEQEGLREDLLGRWH